MSLGALTSTNINLPMGMGMAGGKKDSGQSSGDDKKESSNSILKQIATNTATTVAILSTAVLGTPGEQRDEGIEGGETDPTDKPGLGDRFKGALSGVGSALSKVNPFSSNFAFGNFGRALLAGGGLLLLKQFGEGLIDPLANLLTTIKEGKIGEKLTELKKDVEEKLEPVFLELKEAMTAFIEGAKRVVAVIKSIYTMVNEYVMSFDTGGKTIDLTQYGMGGGIAGGRVEVPDAKLDASEITALKEDLAEKAKNAIGGFIRGVFDGFTMLLLTGAFLKFGADALLNSAAIRTIFGLPVAGSAAAAGAMGTAVPSTSKMKKTKPKLGFKGGLGIAALLTFGIIETFNTFQQAMETALDSPDGKFDFSSFIGEFLGGGKEGGMINAFTKAKDSAGFGALVGMSIGALGGFPGMLFGGLVGVLSGALIGGLAGYAGSDKIKAIIEPFMEVVDDVVRTLGNFFTDVASGFKSLIRGEGFMKGFKERELGNVDNVLNTEADRLEKEIRDRQNILKQFPELGEQGLDVEIADLQAQLDQVNKKITFSPAVAEGMALQDLKDEEKRLISEVNHIEKLGQGKLGNVQLTGENAAKMLMANHEELSAKLGRDVSMAEALPILKKMLENVTEARIKAEKQFTTHDKRSIDAANRIGSGSEMSGTQMDFPESFAGNRQFMVPISNSFGSSRQPGIAIANNSTNDSYNQQHTNILDGLSIADKSTAQMLGLEAELVKGRL
jgi:hypothetical protein